MSLCMCVCVFISTVLPASPPGGFPHGGSHPVLPSLPAHYLADPCVLQKGPEQPPNLHTVEGACEE